jgi:AcrR family transcriptional regulator
MSSKNLQTRNRILESTWKLLEASGGKDVRMTDIAKRAKVSRQAVYLHFPTRAELLIATTTYIDGVKHIDDRLAASRSAVNGTERVDAFIEAWGNYIPEIYGVGKALIAMQDTDEAAAQAWDGRMQAVRHGCAAAIDALITDGRLAADLSRDQAIDIFWTVLSVENWQQLTGACKWSQAHYIKMAKRQARRLLID